ncbi:MAG: hypothetical protein Q9227_002100 [Pyrenula ochraceoflavens]
MQQSFQSNRLCNNLDVLHLICEILAPKDVATFRQVCKAFAEIGVKHLVPNVTFNCSKLSLERLDELSQSPFRHGVKSLRYEANILPVYHSPSCYLNALLENLLQHPDAPEQPSDDMTDREARARGRNFIKFVQEKSLDKRTLVQQFKKYEVIQKGQEQLLEAKGGHWLTLLRAIPRFHSLTSVDFNNMGRCKHALSNRFMAQFDGHPELLEGRPVPHYRLGSSVGVCQAMQFLEALGKGESKLQSIDIGVISPRALERLQVGQWNAARCFQYAKTVRLMFRLDSESEEDLDTSDPENCYDIVKNGYLGEILATAHDLRSLSLLFLDCALQKPPNFELTGLLCHHHWSNLHELTLMSVVTTEGKLRDVLEQYAGSLDSLNLGFISLETGTWIGIFDMMMYELELQNASFWGLFTSYEDKSFWSMKWIYYETWAADQIQYSLGQALSDYVRTGADMFEDEINPLLLADDYFDLSELGVEPDFEDGPSLTSTFPGHDS